MCNGNFDITRMLDQSNLSTQRCRLIFWVECSVGGYLVLSKTIGTISILWQPIKWNLTLSVGEILKYILVGSWTREVI
jgi:hypothetical protein